MTGGRGGRKPTPEEKPKDLQASPEAERAVLGALLLHPEAIAEIEFLEPRYFWSTQHRAIYTAILHMRDDAVPLTPVLLTEQLRKTGTLDAAGGVLYLSEIVGSAATSAGIRQHGAIVWQWWLKRTLRVHGLEMADKSTNGVDPMQILSVFSGELEHLRSLGPQVAADPAAAWTMADIADMMGTIEWLWYPWIPKGFVSMLVGETGIGKSRLLLHIARVALFPAVPWPDGQPQAPQTTDTLPEVCWIETEGRQGLTKQRMEAMQMPFDRLIWFRDPRDPTNRMPTVWFDDPELLQHFANFLKARRPSLVCIDSLRGAHRLGENDSDGIGLRMMKPLSDVARDCKTAITLSHHLNRGRPDQPIHIIDLSRIRGSTSIAQYSITVLGLEQPNPEDDTLRLKLCKHNMTAKPEAIGVIHEDHGITFASQAPEPPRHETQESRVEEFAVAYLKSHGTTPSTVLEDEVDSAGLSFRTLKHVSRKKPHIFHVHQDFHDGTRRWVWSLKTSRTEEQET